MSIDVHPVTPDFVAEIGGVDLSTALTPQVRKAIEQAFATHAVLVFPEQRLSHREHLDFARLFGPLETSIIPGRNDAGRLRVREELADVSNLDHENRTWDRKSRQRMFGLGNRLWHTDSSFRHLPAYASLLYARSIAPVGGHTEFADLRAAYDALPQSMRDRIDDRIVEHSIFHSRAKIGFTGFSERERASLPPVLQRLVRTLPQNGRRSLYLASHAGRVVGMDEAEGRMLLEELMEHATQRQFVHTHRWRVGDLVMWDNRCTMHRATAFDDLHHRRDMQRATVSDVGNTLEMQPVPESAVA